MESKKRTHRRSRITKGFWVDKDLTQKVCPGHLQEARDRPHSKYREVLRTARFQQKGMSPGISFFAKKHFQHTGLRIHDRVVRNPISIEVRNSEPASTRNA